MSTYVLFPFLSLSSSKYSHLPTLPLVFSWGFCYEPFISPGLLLLSISFSSSYHSGGKNVSNSFHCPCCLARSLEHVRCFINKLNFFSEMSELSLPIFLWEGYLKGRLHKGRVLFCFSLWFILTPQNSIWHTVGII